MKKFILLMLMTIGFAFSSHAEVQVYKATSVAFATVNQYNGKYIWSDWERCSI